MKNTKQIEVVASYDQTSVLNGRGNIHQTFDTIGEAKRYAKRCLTDEFQALIEASEPQRYSQVIVDGDCVADYFRKGYTGERDAISA